ncbi:hypothetical protein M092_3279 [Parabacteroides distasonis str. 3776 D15 iv]|uniref:hypothetical protein n=1 Tax=Parabacteroides distasonis TaxID=823 RepID=UPI0004DA5E97|nr:hypothetical protein [Parabacteroides distasonis]KDS69099.1 hypothetical protein M092_3279 [Parabacteroides distasonis str. 3776 D15 iv]UVR24922.1 hypothetical protein NXY22_16105 [Parabacteroides distasonis]
MKPSINLRYKSLLLTCLLIFSAGVAVPAWGQTYTINYKNGSPQTGITERVDTVYVADGEERELFIPELRNNDGVSDPYYRWYVRWYREDGNKNMLSIEGKIAGTDITFDEDHPPVLGGTVLSAATYQKTLKSTSDGKSLFAYDFFYNPSGSNEELRKSASATGASTVKYKVNTVENDVVVCDVSLNTDLVGSGTNEIIEPTLSIRYKFVIRPASVIAGQIRSSGADQSNAFIKEDIFTSQSNEIFNVQLGSIANNYAWYEGENIIKGKTYAYKYVCGNSTKTGKLKPLEQIVDSLNITEQSILEVWAVDETGGKRSPLLYKYTLIPISGAGFVLEDNLNTITDPKRKPDEHPDIYEMIGYINFDRGDSITLEQLKNNYTLNMVKPQFPMADTDKGMWLEPDVTGYAPLDYHRTRGRLTPLQNQYGLYRTANLLEVSETRAEKATTIVSYENFSSKKTTNLQYYWFPTLRENAPNNDRSKRSSVAQRTIYDRTYYNTNHQKLGFFYYVDAANLPGRLVKIKLDGIVCSHTGILVNFWVNDMTTRANETSTGSKAGKPIPPNININFIGRKNGADVILHRFTSGDALTNYTMREAYQGYETNEYIGKWQQLMYSFSFSERSNDFDEYYLEVQNNAIHSYGADYAIDGLRIYRSIPKIDVKRVDVCSSASLTVATDYELLLKNMGWSINPDVLSDLNMGDGITEDSKHIWKYRYGLMGGDPTKRNDNLNETIGNVYIGATDKKENGDITKPEDWITLNTDLKDYKNENYNNRSKVYRIIVPTKDGLKHQGFEDLTNYETAMRRQIVVNLRMINDFLYDVAEQGVWDEDIDAHAQKTNGDPFPKEEYIAYLKQNLGDLCDKSGSEWNYKIPDPKDMESQIDQIMDGYDNKYEELIRAVCSVMGISRPRVPWWDEGNSNTIHLSAIDVDKTELRYKGERPYGSGTKVEPASGKYDVVIFSAAATVTSDKVVDFPNAYAGSSFQDPCLLTTPFTVLPSFTVVANTKSDLPEGMIACEGRISQIEEATVWVEEVDDDQNLTGELNKFEEIEAFKNYSYTFDWFLGDSLEFAAFHERHGVSLEDILRSYRNQLPDEKNALSFQAEALIEYCKDKYKDKPDLIEELKTLLLGDVDTEPKLVIGGKFGYAEFRWVKKVVAIPYLPESITESDRRKWLFCERPQEKTLEAAPAPTLLVGFPDVEYPEEMAHYPNVPLRIGLPNIIEGSINDIPIQGEGLTMGMEKSNQLGKPNGNATTIFLRQGQTYIEVGNLTALSAKAETETDNGGGLFSMTFKEGAYEKFAEGQIYSLYIPFGEYKDGTFVEGSCEGYATLLIKIVPEYLTWTGKNIGEDAEAWYNDANWQQSTEGDLYIDQTGESKKDANGNDLVTAAFAPLHFTRITIPGGQTLELEDLKEDKNLLQGIDTTSKTKATQYIQYDMAVNKNDKGLIVAPYYINKVKAIYFKPEAQLRRQQFLTYDTARVEFEMTPDAKYWMASPLQSVFAGDMYTVKNTGRQNTYAFADITYSTADNDRQAPAFYQKAWDKAITMYVLKSEADQIVSFPENGLDTTHYEVVQSNWSREYNDVNVPYALGKGFYASVEKKNATGLGEKVLVRLPKADDSYKYEPWKPDTKSATLRAAMTKAPTLANRINAGKLADNKSIKVVLTDVNGTEDWWNTDNGTVRVIADGDGKHFLLGNPYMYPLDIVRFLKENEAILEQKYWTLDVKEGLVVGTPDVAWENEDTDAASGAVIAPMQAFFVELKDAAQTKAEGTVTGADLKVVRFDPSMMQGEPEKVSSSLRTATAKNPVLRLTAERDAYRSTALLTRQDDATNNYEADKDAVILLDTELEEIPQVYTIAGTRAVGVNVARRVDQIPLGVYAGEGKGEVTLTIEGIGDWAETLYLYDAVTRKSTELSGDTYTLRLDGSSHGRYFLSAGSPTGNEGVGDAESISVYSAASGKVVVSASEALKRIQVFTPMGRLVRTLYPARPTYTFALPAGIYIIRAEIAHDQKTVKLRVL